MVIVQLLMIVAVVRSSQTREPTLLAARINRLIRILRRRRQSITKKRQKQKMRLFLSILDVCVYIYIHTHLPIYIYMYVCIHIYICICMYTHINIDIHTHIQMCIYIYIHTCMYTYIFESSRQELEQRRPTNDRQVLPNGSLNPLSSSCLQSTGLIVSFTLLLAPLTSSFANN